MRTVEKTPYIVTPDKITLFVEPVRNGQWNTIRRSIAVLAFGAVFFTAIKDLPRPLILALLALAFVLFLLDFRSAYLSSAAFTLVFDAARREVLRVRGRREARIADFDSVVKIESRRETGTDETPPSRYCLRIKRRFLPGEKAFRLSPRFDGENPEPRWWRENLLPALREMLFGMPERGNGGANARGKAEIRRFKKNGAKYSKYFGGAVAFGAVFTALAMIGFYVEQAGTGDAFLRTLKLGASIGAIFIGGAFVFASHYIVFDTAKSEIVCWSILCLGRRRIPFGNVIGPRLVRAPRGGMTVVILYRAPGSNKPKRLLLWPIWGLDSMNRTIEEVETILSMGNRI